MDYLDSNRLEDIKNLYNELLEREADEPGLINYYNSELTIDQIKQSIQCSSERAWIINKKGDSVFKVSEVESWLFIGQFPFKKDCESLKEFGITCILDITDTGNTEEEDKYDESEFNSLKIPIPENAIISTNDLEKALKFIKETEERGEKIFICDRFGSLKAPAIVVLWYIANGMDYDAARLLVESKRSGIDISAALIGPWHIDAATNIFKE